MKSNEEKRHDNICDVISKELSARGWNTITNKEYSTSMCGEIDVIGYKDNYAIYVEVKCNLNYKNRKKAEKQLTRARYHCPYHENKRLFTMIATRNKNNIQYNWFKDD